MIRCQRLWMRPSIRPQSVSMTTSPFCSAVVREKLEGAGAGHRGSRDWHSSYRRYVDLPGSLTWAVALPSTLASMLLRMERMTDVIVLSA